MGKVETALTGALAKAVDEAVASGAYASAEEVLREALRDWTARRARDAGAEARLRALWDEGLASGPGEGLDIEAIKARARARCVKRAGGLGEEEAYI